MTATHQTVSTEQTTYLSRVPGAEAVYDDAEYRVETQDVHTGAWHIAWSRISHQRAIETALIFAANGIGVRIEQLVRP